MVSWDKYLQGSPVHPTTPLPITHCPSKVIGSRCRNEEKWLGMKHLPFTCHSETLGSVGRRKAIFHAWPFPLVGRQPGAPSFLHCLETPGGVQWRKAMESHYIALIVAGRLLDSRAIGKDSFDGSPWPSFGNKGHGKLSNNCWLLE